MSDTIDLREGIPASLRKPLDSNALKVLPALLPTYLPGAGFDEVLGFVLGAIDHQERVSHEDSKVFKGKIIDVEVFERKSGDGKYVVGRKAKIHFEGQGKNGVEEQSIDTDWLEYNSKFGRLDALADWSEALSNTLVAIAKENIGNECFLRKAFVEAETASGGTKVRYLADLWAAPTKRDDNTSSGRTSSRTSDSGRSSRRESEPEEQRSSRRSRDDAPVVKVLDVDDLLDLRDRLDIPKDVIRNADIKDIAGILKDNGLDVSKVTDEVYDLFKDDLKDIVDAGELEDAIKKADDDFQTGILKALDKHL